MKERREVYKAVVVGPDEQADEEAYLCTITLPADEKQPERNVTLPYGFTLSELERTTQLSLF